MRKTVWAGLVSVLVLATAGCGGGKGGTTATGNPPPSPAPSSAPSTSAAPAVCRGGPDFDAAAEVRARSTVDDGGDLPVLRIDAGPVLCDFVKIQMTYVRFGAPREQAVPLALPETVEPYDGITGRQIRFPLLGQECMGAVVHLADRGATVTTPLTGVATGAAVHLPAVKDMYDLSPVLDDGVIAVAGTPGDACASDLKLLDNP